MALGVGYYLRLLCISVVYFRLCPYYTKANCFVPSSCIQQGAFKIGILPSNRVLYVYFNIIQPALKNV